jgi:ribosome-binding factor A
MARGGARQGLAKFVASTFRYRPKRMAMNLGAAHRVRLGMRTDVRRNRSQHRKALQLCSQVADTLNYVLGDDSSLAGLLVTSVEPAPDSSCLLVTLCPHLADEPLDAQATLARLEASGGRLRFEVASAITRKRAPKLLFRLDSGITKSHNV